MTARRRVSFADTPRPPSGGPVITGVPLLDCAALNGDPQRIRQAASIRCTGCHETFARLVATPDGPILIYRPTIWEHPDGARWTGDADTAVVDQQCGGPSKWRGPRHALPLDHEFARDVRAALACRCSCRPHLADPAALRRMAVHGGAAPAPQSDHPDTRTLAAAPGQPIDGYNPLRTVAELRRIGNDARNP